MEHYEKLQAMYALAPINRFFQPTLQLGHGEAEVRITVRPDFHHSAGGMHGSVYFKALDDATFFAAQSLEHEVFVLTAHFEIDLLKPVAEGEIQALARVTHDTGHRIEATGELFDSSGDVVARGLGRFARRKTRLGPDVGYRLPK